MHRRPLRLEPLEERRLLAIGFDWDGTNDILTILIDASDSETNIVDIEENSGHVIVTTDAGLFSSGVAAPNIAGQVDTIVIHGATVGSLIDVSDAELHNVLLFPDLEELIVRAGPGDDRIVLGPHGNLVVGVEVNGGAPGSGSDVLVLDSTGGGAQDVRIEPDDSIPGQTNVSGFGPDPLEVTGVEVVLYDGDDSDGGDDLTVAMGAGTAVARVENTALGRTDVVTSNRLPAIEFDHVATFTLQGSSGGGEPTVATFATNNLEGADDYEFDSEGEDTLVIDGGDAENDDFTVTDPTLGDVAVTDENHSVTVTAFALSADDDDRLQINGLGGDDSVTVDVDAASPSDLIGVPITFDGGPGSDRLIVEGTPPGVDPVDEVIYRPGPHVTEGRLRYEDDGDNPLMTIDFVNLEPVAALVPAPTFTVNGTPADNAVNYEQTPGDATRGRVTVDAYELIDFSNKQNLVINGLAGSDLVNLNNAATPTALTGITVNGGDPTGSDTVIVNGTTGADTITMTYDLSPSPPPSSTTAPATDEARIVGAQPVPVEVDTAELLILNGQGGDDDLTVTTPSGANTITYTPGDTRDSASLLTDDLLPMRFTGLGVGVGASVTLDDPAVARVDTLVVNGMPTNDVFHVAATSGAVTLVGTPGPFLTLSTPGVDDLRLNGLAGDDEFNLVAPQPYETILVNGGEPDASDAVNLTGTDGDDPLRVFFAAPPLPSVQGFPVPIRITGFGTALAPIALVGVENVTMDGAGDADSLNLNGTALDDTFTYTPTGAEAGIFKHEDFNTVFSFTDVGGTFNINGLAAGADAVVVEGTNSRDVFTIANRFVEVEDSLGTTLKRVLLGGSVEILTALGRQGDDTFRVSPLEGVPAAPLDNLRVYLDGGEPAASDALVLESLPGVPLPDTDFAIVHRGRHPDEGVVRVFRDGTGVVGDEVLPGPFTAPVQFPDIAYTNTEIVAPNVFVDPNGDPNLLILGPDGLEPNEFRANAAYLGSGRTLNVEHLAVFPNANEHPGVPADQDWMRVVAEVTGTLDFQVYFRQFNPELLPAGGDLSIEVRDADGTLIAGTGAFGSGDANDDERVRIPAVAGQTYYLRVLGADDNVVNGYDLTVVNTPAPVPYDIELQDTPVGDPPPANSDTGRSQFDNVTRDDTPTIYLRLDDGSLRFDLPGNDPGVGGFPNNPPDETIPIPFQTAFLPGFRVAIFDEGPTPAQPATNPQIPVGFATEVPGSPGLYTFTFPAALSDGSHFINARVQMIDPSDPDNNVGTADHWSGFGPRSLSMEMVVDTLAPPVLFGIAGSATDGLHPQSDTGVAGLPATFTDRITSDTTPTFFGTAEANAVIRLYVDMNGNGTVEAADVLLGQTVAVPLDGTNQFPNGYWELTSSVDMNDPEAFPAPLSFDGRRTILVTAEDPAGEVSNAETLDVFLDTQGPRVTDVYLTDDPGFNLFDPKPSEGPTPLVKRLSVDIEDLPDRVSGFLYQALAPGIFPGDPATEPGHFLVRGDHNGVIRIQNIQFLPDPVVAGQPATGTIVVTFFEPLPDDRFTLTISDDLVDPAGNRLDGENNAVEPQDPPEFPSGDGQPGGDFVARFTVDSRPEIGVWAAGSVYVDTNGNFQFDPENPDSTNRDIVYTLGFTTDYVFAGNFVQAPGGTADGFDKLAVYGSTAAGFRWLVDVTNDGIPDLTVAEPAAVTGVPVAGNFDVAGGQNGDEVGVFTGTTWRLDTNHDFRVDFLLVSALRGFPIVGDFDGDGYDDLATLNNQRNRFEFDLTGGAFAGWDGTIDDTIVLPFGEFIGVRERPVAADMDADGIDDIGLWVPDRGGMTPRESGEWYFLISNDPAQEGRNPGTVNTLDHVFTPVPFGHDIFAQFGDEFGVPVVGNFDPPVTGGAQQPDQAPGTDQSAADVSQADGAPAPTVVSLAGTSGNDVFRLMPGPTPHSWIAALGGVRQQIDDNPVAIEFDGLGGDDKIKIILTGAGAGEMTAELWPGRVSFAGAGISFTARNTETISIDGRESGEGTARFHDSEGDDRFRATPDWAKLWGNGFLNQVLGFSHVVAQATSGGTDVAQLFDSPGNDQFEASPEYARLSGNGFDLRAEGFRYANGYAQNGGSDTARLYDSEGDDRFRAAPDWAMLRGEGFHTRALGFATVYGYATSGGIDVAQLFDSPGSDHFEASPDYARLSGNGFDLRAEGFRYANGYAQNGGNDTASIHDSALDDHLKARDDWARLFNNDPQLGFSIRAAGFENVLASSSGEDDTKDIDADAVDWLITQGWQ